MEDERETGNIVVQDPRNGRLRSVKGTVIREPYSVRQLIEELERLLHQLKKTVGE